MSVLCAEVECAEAGARPVDFGDTIRECLRMADSGMWEQKLKLPNGRRWTVRRIVNAYGLERLVNYREE
jgi:hypothetical protein